MQLEIKLAKNLTQENLLFLFFDIYIVVMKNFFLFYFILLSMLPLHAQERGEYFRVTYKKIPPLTNAQKLKEIENPNTRQQIEAVDYYMRTLRYDLFVSKGASIFKKQEQMDKDGIGIMAFAEIVGGGNGIYYFNREDKELFHQQKLGKTYLVNINLSKYDWIVHKETTIIAGYKCYRATTEEKIDVGLTISSSSSNSTTTRTLEVWFAPNLPGMFGPTEYVGLPGLVLRASGAGSTFEAICVESINSIPIVKPEGKQITEEEYTKKVTKSMKRIRGY